MSDSQTNPTNKRSRASLLAHGEPMVWLSGGALVLAVCMTLLLLLYVFFNGMFTFWPSALDKVVWDDENGKQHAFLGEMVQSEIRSAEEGGDRYQYKTGNYDLTNFHFIWVNESAIKERSQPDDAVVIERLSWGRFHGIPTALTIDGEVVASDSKGVINEANKLMTQIIDRREERMDLEKHEMGALSRQEQTARLETVLVREEMGRNSIAYKEALAEFEQIKLALRERVNLSWMQSRHYAKKMHARCWN